MKRNLLLVLLVFFGAVAVGALFLLSGGGAGGARATTDGGGRGGGALAVRGGSRGATGSQVVTPEMARNRQGGKMIGSAVEPGIRTPFDDPDAILEREKNSTRMEQLIRDLLDPKFDYDQKHAKSLELEQLLRLMGHRVSPEVRQRLLEMLATGATPTIKNQMGSLIGALDGDTDTAKALLEMLRNTDDGDTRRAVYSALGKMNVHDVTPKLLSMLGEGLGDEEVYIIRAIGNLATPDEIDQLFARLDSAGLDKPLNGASRTEIEQVLQQRGRIPGFFDKVAASLDETKDVQKRRSLLRILSASISPNHATKVRELLKTEADPESRAIAIQALGKYGDVESGKTLLDLVQTGSPEDRTRANQAINTIRNRDTIAVFATPSVWAGLTPDGKIAVMGAVSRTTATEGMLNLAQEQGLVDDQLLVKTAAARTLGVRGREDSVEPLVAFLERSTHPAERSAAFASLEQIHTKKAALAAIRVLRVVPSERERSRLEERFNAIANEPDPRNPEESK